MLDVTDTSFEVDVLGAEGPVAVDFWAPWCGPCKAVGTVLEELAAAHPEVTFVKMNIDDEPNAASRYGVLSIPTVILFSGGEQRASVVGARPLHYFEKAFAGWL